MIAVFLCQQTRYINIILTKQLPFSQNIINRSICDIFHFYQCQKKISGFDYYLTKFQQNRPRNTSVVLVIYRPVFSGHPLQPGSLLIYDGSVWCGVGNFFYFWLRQQPNVFTIDFIGMKLSNHDSMS